MRPQPERAPCGDGAVKAVGAESRGPERLPVCGLPRSDIAGLDGRCRGNPVRGPEAGMPGAAPTPRKAEKMRGRCVGGPMGVLAFRNFRIFAQIFCL